MTRRILAFAAIILPIATAQAQTFTSEEVNGLVSAAYVCGLQRMKVIVHKPIDPMTAPGEEYCATIKVRATYHPEYWQWLYPQNDSSQGSTEDQVLRR